MKIMIEEKNEGLEALAGKVVTLFCLNYFYTGKLVGINDTQVKLADPSIVYETGEWTSKDWARAEKLPTDALYVRLSAIESYAVLK